MPMRNESMQNQGEDQQGYMGTQVPEDEKAPVQAPAKGGHSISHNNQPPQVETDDSDEAYLEEEHEDPSSSGL